MCHIKISIKSRFSNIFHRFFRRARSRSGHIKQPHQSRWQWNWKRLGSLPRKLPREESGSTATTTTTTARARQHAAGRGLWWRSQEGKERSSSKTHQISDSNWLRWLHNCRLDGCNSSYKILRTEIRCGGTIVEEYLL